MSSEFVLTLSCPDRIGIVYAVAKLLQRNHFTILDSAQYGDPNTGLFCMRIHFSPRQGSKSLAEVRQLVAPVAGEFGMQWDVYDCAVRPRVVIMVSRQDHCLNDLLYRHRTGALFMDVVSVISNHTDCRSLVEAHGIEYLHMPRNADNRAEADRELDDYLTRTAPELVVLARYMQILPASLCESLAGRIINIHHSFLPGFKGARPYAQAYDRGVKLIGATAHYVTADLDEGPIIDQDVERVDHSMTAAHLQAVGQDIEQIVLARALRFHLEHRIILNGHKTVVFR